MDTCHSGATCFLCCYYKNHTYMPVSSCLSSGPPITWKGTLSEHFLLTNFPLEDSLDGNSCHKDTLSTSFQLFPGPFFCFPLGAAPTTTCDSFLSPPLGAACSPKASQNPSEPLYYLSAPSCSPVASTLCSLPTILPQVEFLYFVTLFPL